MLLVTGSTGHTGLHFMKKLEESRYSGRVRCIVRANSDTSELGKLALEIEYKVGVLEDSDFVDGSMKDIDQVIHIAGIHWTQNITHAALKNKVQLVFCVHTTGRYSRFKSASSDYIRIEDEAIASGLNFIILRPTMIYGSSKDRNIYKLIDFLHRHKLFPVFGSGKNIMQPIHAKDLAKAIFDAWKNKERTLNKCYNVAGANALTYLELLRTISRQLDRNIIFVKIPVKLSLAAAYVYNFISRNAIISVEQVLRMNEDKAFEFGEATHDFAFIPISFEEGVKGEVREYLASHA